MNKVLFVDFNGVLSYKPFRHHLTENPEYTSIRKHIDHALFTQRKDLVEARMIGQKTSEDICCFLAEHVPVSEEFLLQNLQESCRSMDVSQKILDHLQKLKWSYRLVLMTDNMDCFERRTLTTRAAEFSIFDDICSSFREKLLKKSQNGESFRRRIDTYRAVSHESILVDDSEKNCIFFRENIGGHSLHVSGEDNVVAALKQLVI